MELINFYDIDTCEFTTTAKYRDEVIRGVSKLRKKAQDMGVPVRDAFLFRINYLRETGEDNHELELITKALVDLDKPKRSNYVTDDMKEEAHSVDVEIVLEAAGIHVNRNKTLKCPFHNDTSESASIKRGVLVCFAGCVPEWGNSKGFDAVACYRKLFEVSYFEAVRQVCLL